VFLALPHYVRRRLQQCLHCFLDFTVHVASVYAPVCIITGAPCPPLPRHRGVGTGGSVQVQHLRAQPEPPTKAGMPCMCPPLRRTCPHLSTPAVGCSSDHAPPDVPAAAPLWQAARPLGTWMQSWRNTAIFLCRDLRRHVNPAAPSDPQHSCSVRAGLYGVCHLTWSWHVHPCSSKQPTRRWRASCRSWTSEQPSACCCLLPLHSVALPLVFQLTFTSLCLINAYLHRYGGTVVSRVKLPCSCCGCSCLQVLMQICLSTTTMYSQFKPDGTTQIRSDQSTCGHTK
jgi:hypothetical protein